MKSKGPELVEVSALIDGGESAAGRCLRRVSPVIVYIILFRGPHVFTFRDPTAIQLV